MDELSGGVQTFLGNILVVAIGLILYYIGYGVFKVYYEFQASL